MRPAEAGELIVGNEKGLELWAADGSSHRQFSAGPALHPRRSQGDALVVIDGQDSNLNLGAQLVRISLLDGSRTPLVKLPAFACANPPSEEGFKSPELGLDVQDAGDFELDASGRVACLSLMDRNANMADLQLKVRVELDTGRVQRWLTLGEDECTAPADVVIGEPSEGEWCDPTVEPTVERPAPQFAFDFDPDTGWVKQLGDKPIKHARLKEYMLEQVSPSGRWLVLGGDLQEGDYIHRSLVLCDRKDGAVYPVLAEPSPWPAPLTAAKRAIKVPEDGMADVVGESDVRWLKVDSMPELLVVDRLVIRPEGPSWTFEGELVQ